MSSLNNDEKNERRNSVIQRNCFYSFFSTRDTETEQPGSTDRWKPKGPVLLTRSAYSDSRVHGVRSVKPSLQWRKQIFHQPQAVLQYLQPQRQQVQLKTKQRYRLNKYKSINFGKCQSGPGHIDWDGSLHPN